MAKKSKIRRSQKQLYFILGITIASVFVLTIAYALVSSTLNISINKVTQQNVTFGPVFQGTANSTISATPGGTSGTGRTCGSAKISANRKSITVADTTLSKPDDSCTWTVTVKNEATITAKLLSITPTSPSSTTCETANNGMKMTCGNITYILATNTSGTTFPTLNSTLAQNATLSLYLIAKYTGTTLNSTAVTQTGATFTMNWGQA